jgi:hypothetical protein
VLAGLTLEAYVAERYGDGGKRMVVRDSKGPVTDKWGGSMQSQSVVGCVVNILEGDKD